MSSDFELDSLLAAASLTGASSPSSPKASASGSTHSRLFRIAARESEELSHNFEASSLCLLRGDGDVDDDGDGDDDGEEVQGVKYILGSQRKVLELICGRNNSYELIWSDNLYVTDYLWIPRFPNVNITFLIDLVGSLRRHVRALGKTRDDANVGKHNDVHHHPLRTKLWSMCMQGSLFAWFSIHTEWIRHLKEMTSTCFSNLWNLESLHIVACSDFELIRPILQPARHHLQELRLSRVTFESEDELSDFASCFAPPPATTAAAETSSRAVGNPGWQNLTKLIFHGLILRGGKVCVDPILRAVGGANEGRGHLPNLKTFQLLHLEVLQNYRLIDQDVLVHFMHNRTTIKHMTLQGFVEPEHCRLIERHLSAHPNIETLELNAEDFFKYEVRRCYYTCRKVRLPGEDLAILESMKSLVRLAAANPNLTRIDLCATIDLGGPFPSPLDRMLQSHCRELITRTRLNRHGLVQFRGGGLSSSTSWARRECVDFLIRLLSPEGNGNIGRWLEETYEEDVASLVALDSLYVSLRMRPDLCLLS